MAVLTPHDTIIVHLPYPVKIMGVTLYIKRKIGFTFTNLANLLFYEEYKTTTSKKFSEWVEKNGQVAAFNELTYFAAVAYCQLSRKKPNFEKDKLFKAIAATDRQTQQSILECWQKSQQMGEGSKKKVNPKSKVKK